MSIREQWKPLVVLTGMFLAFYFLPFSKGQIAAALQDALVFTQWYARQHVLLCLIPAFLIAGAIAVFISRESVIRLLGQGSNPVTAYSVASVSGAVLAVCSCTVLPLFAGIYKRGAGLGPATAFLYSGPAINVLAIILTARVLGWQLGIARAIGAVLFSVVIGLLMHLIFRNEQSAQATSINPGITDPATPLTHTAVFFAIMVAILVFATWGGAGTGGAYAAIQNYKWILTSILAALFASLLCLKYNFKWWKFAVLALLVLISVVAFPGQQVASFTMGVLGLALILATEKGEGSEWLEQSWILAKQIMPLLFIGVLVAGFLLGFEGHGGLIPQAWIVRLVGGNSIWSNLFASAAGALMYFATLTEIPILEGLTNGGMGNGPALSLLLAGPALSLPNMLVIASVIGWKKTGVFVALVVVMATLSGMAYGAIAG